MSSSTYSLSRQWIEIGSQIHAPAILRPWEANHCVGFSSGLGV
jgi:hypothetical protein